MAHIWTDRFTVLLISPADLRWAGIRATIAAMQNLRICAEAATAADATREAFDTDPSLIIAPTVLHSDSTLQIITKLRTMYPASKIVVFAAQPNLAEYLDFSRVDAAGYFSIDGLDCATLEHILHVVTHTDVIIHTRILDAGPEVGAEQSNLSAESIALDPRELAVLRLLSEGYTRQQIARHEHLSLRTVYRIIERLRYKCDASSAFTLGMKARSLNILA